MGTNKKIKKEATTDKASPKKTKKDSYDVNPIPGKPPKPGVLGKQKEDPEDGNIGKNNAGGFE